jgi:hypothetical protein
METLWASLSRRSRGLRTADCGLESFNPATEELLGLFDSSQQSPAH